MASEAELLQEAQRRGLIPAQAPSENQPSDVDRLLLQEAERRGMAAQPFIGQRGPGAQSVLSDQPRFVPVEDIARRAGILLEGAPPGARFAANLGLGETQDLASTKAALETVFNEPVDVRIGPETGAFEFRRQSKATDERGGGFTLLNRPGLDAGDFAAIAPEVARGTVEVAAGIGGAVGGSLAAGPPGAVAGVITAESLASFGSTLALLNFTNKVQNLGLTDDQIFNSAIQRAGLTAAGAALGPILGSITRRVIGRVPNALLKAFPATAEEGLQGASDVAGEVEQRTGQPFPFTAGQATRSEELQTAEQAISRTRAGEPIRNIFEAQESAIQGLATGGLPQPAGRLDEISAARSLQQQAGRGPAQAIARVEAEAAQAVQQAEAAARDITRRSLDREIAGEEARDAITGARERVFAPIRAEFDLIEQQADITIDLSGFRTTANALRSELGENQLRSLVSEDLPVVTEATRAGQRTTERTVQAGPLVRTIQQVTNNEPVSFRAVQRDISNLREELRRVDKGLTPKKKRVLTRLLSSMTEARNSALRNDPELFNRVMAAEARFKQAKQNFDRGIIGEILRVEEGGRFRLSGTQVIDKVLRSPRDAADIMRVLSEQAPEAVNLIRKGVLDEYMRRVVDPRTQLAQIPQHKTFIRSFSPSLRVLFPDDELKKLLRPGTAGDFAVSQTKRAEKVRATLDRAFGRRIQSVEPEVLADDVFKQGRLRDFTRARNILKRSPDDLATFDAAVARRVVDRITSFNASVNTRLPDASKIAEFLESPLMPHVRAAFGERYIEDLRLVQRAFDVAGLAPRRPVRDLADLLRPTTGLQGLARFTRVAFPPLSPRGRALTASVGVVRTQTAERIVAALSNPKQLSDLVKLNRMILDTRPAQAIIGGLGMDLFGAAPLAEMQLGVDVGFEP